MLQDKNEKGSCLSPILCVAAITGHLLSRWSSGFFRRTNLDEAAVQKKVVNRFQTAGKEEQQVDRDGAGDQKAGISGEIAAPIVRATPVTPAAADALPAARPP